MRFSRFTSAWKTALLLCILFAFSGIAHAQKPGAFLWADADGNSLIEVPDYSALATILSNPSADDTLIYQGHPQSRFRQELDGNGLIEVPDLSILLSWLVGDFSNRPGNPDQLALDETSFSLMPGDSVSLSAYALSPASQGAALRTGLGVIFKIDPSGTCTTAQIFGYDVAGGATVNTWRDNAAYHYTLKPGPPDNGRATVRVNSNGCSYGSVVKVEVYIPSDAEAGVVPGRFPDKLAASQLITVTVEDSTAPDTFITSSPPDPDDLLETSFEFSCSEPSCTYECKMDASDWESCSSSKNYGAEESWVATSTANAPMARYYHRAVWTGTEMIIWGGYNGSNLNTGGRYDPATDSWTATTTNNAPTERLYHTAVWTGTEMIVWGGSSSGEVNTGGRYNPMTDSWTPTSTTNAPTARDTHTAIWTGTEMIVWGGYGIDFYNTGGRYDPATDSWNSTNTLSAPSVRYKHTAVWTGTEMIVWGGWCIDELNTGGRYNPSTDSWTATTTTNAPSARDEHTAVWTGTEMIVWGGGSNTGGRYNPITNSWIATTITDAPYFQSYNSASAVWTGKEMIVWGGQPGYSQYTNTGGRYDPSTDSWIATTTSNAPAARCNHTAVWTGTRMIVWGGNNGSGLLNTGGMYAPYCDLGEGDHTFEVRAYDLAMNVDPTPATYSWTIAIPPDTFIDSHPPDPDNSISAQFTFSCTDDSCIFECNLDSSGWEPCTSPTSYELLLATLHTFEVRATDIFGNTDPTPASFTWTVNPTETEIGSHPPAATKSTTAEFTVSCNRPECIFECNLDSTGWEPCNSYIAYMDLLPATHTFEARATDLAGTTDPTPAGFTWTIDLTPPDTFINSNPPDPDTNFYADFTFTCSEPPCTYDCNLDSSGWVECASPKHYDTLPNGPHTFAVRAYDPATNVDPSPATYSWTINAGLPDTFITSYPPDPTNSQETIFEFTCSEAECTYDCQLDSSGWESCSSPKNYIGPEYWTETSTTNVPSARYYHQAVWSGTEMIVWGGQIGSSTYTNTGGRYNPVTDSWTATTTTNAPSARRTHTAVWTGTVMIVWGGYGSLPSYKNDGGRYNPATNSWAATSTTNAPSARYYHQAVWSGTEMIVWGGQIESSTYTNTGGRYNPATNSWTATTTTNAPSGRRTHTVVWTGTEMIVWGGYGSSPTYKNDGGRYNPATDSWTATTTTDAPTARDTHSAIWTGVEMVVWGGYGGTYLNTGGRYNPGTDSWTATTTANAPSIRSTHTAVWTGIEMIVWGGIQGTSYLDTGGRYNPETDSWLSTTITNVPPVRSRHTAVWTGTKMIAWGGYNVTFFYTGGIYSPGGFNLAEGEHTFEVRAYDQGMNVDPTPASYTWTIDLTPPETTITLAPPDPSDSPDAEFEFSCSEPDCDFECQLDATGWVSCTSPWLYTDLLDGDHTFQVRATDAAGNLESPPVEYIWAIDTTP